MSIWISIIIAGLINYLSRLSSVLIINPKSMNYTTKQVLKYVPSAIFPAIIFPAIFLDNSGLFQLENNPKILASVVAVTVGMLSKNIIATIITGLAAYWFLIFF